MLVVEANPLPNRIPAHSEFSGQGPHTTITFQVPLYKLALELLFVLRHEKHPKGWIGVQLLGCSSMRAFLFMRAFFAPADPSRNIGRDTAQYIGFLAVFAAVELRYFAHHHHGGANAAFVIVDR